MSKWFTNFNLRFRRSNNKRTQECISSKSRPSQSVLQPQSFQVVQNEINQLATDRKSLSPDKNLGDVCVQKITPDTKKPYGVPLLLTEQLYSAGKEAENVGSFTEPPSLDANLMHLSVPPITDHATGVTEEINGGKNQKRLTGFRRWFAEAKKKYLVATSGIVESSEPTKSVTNRESFPDPKGRSETKKFMRVKDGNPIGNVPKRKKEKKGKKEKKVKSKKSKTTEYSAHDSQISYHLPVYGVLEESNVQIPEVCESQKLSDDGDTNAGILMHNVPQLHRSSETLDQRTLISQDLVVDKQKKTKSIAKHSSPLIHRDSRLAKISERNVGEHNRGQVPDKLSKKDQESQYSPPKRDKVAKVERSNPTTKSTDTKPMHITKSSDHVGLKTEQGGDSKLNMSVPKSQTGQFRVNPSESDSSIVVAEPRTPGAIYKTLRRKSKKTKNTSILVSISSKPWFTASRKRRTCYLSSKLIESEGSGSLERTEGRLDSQRKETSDAASSASEDSSWCRRICEQDKNLRKNISKQATDSSTHQQGRRSSRSAHRSRKQNDLVRKSSQSGQGTPKSSPKERLNILLRHADTMIEELIDRLAWDMAEAIVSRANYARTLSCRSNQVSVLRIRASSSHRRNTSGDGSACSTPYLQSPPRESPLVD
ncbi:unnamed protein product [Echinostoma caproni]|uniref:DUF4585 domain-containing protein n=1 Tax=Echinostoma caproni TaxID=27848 RepID=A0A183AW11_9TREM|nr:unnamed protein product [Echinostoma caproni]